MPPEFDFGVFGVGAIIFFLLVYGWTEMRKDRDVYRDRVWKAEDHARTAQENMEDLLLLVKDLIRGRS